LLGSRRRSKNSGGIAPAAIAALIEGSYRSVNVFAALRNRQARLAHADKVLTRLNFPCCAGNA
jgi:hypothetical protein